MCLYVRSRACVGARAKVRALNTTSSTIGRIAEGEQRQPPIGLKHTLLSIAGDIYRCARARVCGCAYTRPYSSCIVALANEKVASFAIPERGSALSGNTETHVPIEGASRRAMAVSRKDGVAAIIRLARFCATI